MNAPERTDGRPSLSRAEPAVATAVATADVPKRRCEAVPWQGVLVSVHDAAEAVEALAGGAAIIDVKNPFRGPLGRADPTAAATIAATVGPWAPWTIACGELAEDERAAAHVGHVLRRLAGDSRPPVAAKAGPAGLDGLRWTRAFETFQAELPPGIEPVAVAYGDWQAAEAPPPSEIVGRAAAAGCRVLLLDTFDKQGPGILEAAPPNLLVSWIASADQAGLAVVLAGRLTVRELPLAWALGPRVLAVRGAACVGGRWGRVDRRAVAAAVGCGSGTIVMHRRADQVAADSSSHGDVP